MVVTLDILTDIYSQPNHLGKQKLIKRNVKFKKTFDTNFMQVEHYIDSKGNVSKKYCTVFNGDNGFKAAHKFEFVESLITPIKVKGFMHGH